MEERLSPLIAERAPWLYRNRPGTNYVRRCLNHLLSYNATVRIAEQLRDAPADQIMSEMCRRLAKSVTVSGKGNLHAQGPALIVCNHPTGLADGIVLHHLIAGLRPDLYFFANRDILRVFPQMEKMIAPVEWRKELRSHAKTRDTMRFVRQATEDGRLGVIFPSGRLAKRKGLRLYEREWMASAAMLARKFDLPVIPINIQARNSVLFYLFDKLHPTLRDITLFHETLNKSKQPFHVAIGEPISAASMPKTADEGIALLRAATLGLGGKDAPAVNLVAASRSWLKSS